MKFIRFMKSLSTDYQKNQTGNLSVESKEKHSEKKGLSRLLKAHILKGRRNTIVVLIPFIPKVRGLAVLGFLIIINKKLSEEDKKVVLNHEEIHIAQQRELFIVMAYIWYYVEYLFCAIRYKSLDVGRKQISFEREAYENQKDITYLYHRKPGAFLNYIQHD